jgi:hypothetical protein
MADEREQVPTGELARWLVLGVAVLIGLGLYLVLGRDLEPVAPPAVVEEAP